MGNGFKNGHSKPWMFVVVKVGPYDVYSAKSFSVARRIVRRKTPPISASNEDSSDFRMASRAESLTFFSPVSSTIFGLFFVGYGLSAIPFHTCGIQMNTAIDLARLITLNEN